MLRKNLFIFNGLVIIAIVVGLLLNIMLIEVYNEYKKEINEETYITAKEQIEKHKCYEIVEDKETLKCLQGRER